jgi:3-oxoadipate enol-lactonase
LRLAHTVVIEGDAPPIVLLHSLALDRTMWGRLLNHLDTGRRVITMDMRGHGESPKDPHFTIEDMADDVVETLLDLGHDGAVVVGLSMGGCVAQAMSIRHPSTVVGLGLIDTTSWYGPHAPERWSERAAKAEEKGMLSLAQFQLDRWFGPRFLAGFPEVGQELLEVFARNDLGSYVASCHAMGAFDARQGLDQVHVPTVVVVGEDDPATTPAHAQELHRRIQGSTLKVIDDAKHLTPVESPQEVAEALKELWLAPNH